MDILVEEKLKSEVFEFTWLEPSPSAIPITLQLNSSYTYLFEKNSSLNAFLDSLEKKLADVESLAKDAFIKKNKTSWDEVQKLLYLWNIQSLHNTLDFSNYSDISTNLLRKKVLEIETQQSQKHFLESKWNFTPESAIQELADRANSHRINHHPLLDELNSNGLLESAIKTFLNNYYVNNRLFHLFLATLSPFTPLEKRTELASNFYDELGCGDVQMAHPLLFLKNFDTIGKPEKIEPLPESLFLANTKFFCGHLYKNYHYGFGGFGFIELTMPAQMKKILNGLKKSNIPEKDLEFWRVHITIDEEHGKSWMNEMQHLIHNEEEAELCLQGGMSLLEARATMYDGIWDTINKKTEGL